MSDETKSPGIWFLGLFAALAVFALVGAYSLSMARHNTSGYDDQREQERYAKLSKLKDEDEKKLTTADWIDQAKGTVRIPIDEAMTAELAALKAKPVRMGDALPAAAPPATANTLPATNAAPTDTNAPPAVKTSAPQANDKATAPVALPSPAEPGATKK